MNSSPHRIALSVHRASLLLYAGFSTFAFAFCLATMSFLALASLALDAAPVQAAESRVVGRMVGRVTKAQGEVLAVGERGRIVKVGMRVYEGDELHTGKNSRVEIQFVDESTLTLSDKTVFKVEKFIYHPAVDKAGMALSMLRGAFRLVNARLGFARPTDVTIATPLATIGIRGTDFWGGFFKPEELGVLLISGKNLTITNEAGSETIAHPGYGVTATSATTAPGKPLKWKPEKVERAMKSVQFD